MISLFNQIYPPESRTEESKLQSRLLQKLGLHLYIFICILMLIYVHSMLPLKLKPRLYRRWRDPLYPRVPRPRSQFCSHLRRRVRRSRKRNIFQHVLLNIFQHILRTFHLTSWSCCSFSAFISELMIFKYLSSTYDPSIIFHHIPSYHILIYIFNSTYCCIVFVCTPAVNM